MVCFFRLDIAMKEDPVTGEVPYDRLVRVFDNAEDAASFDATDDRPPILLSKEAYNLLDLGLENSAKALADILDAHQVFRFAMELVLDEAFANSETDPVLRELLEEGLGDNPWPNKAERGKDPTNMVINEGELQYPFLDHLETRHLAELYIHLLEGCSRTKAEGRYGLDRVIKVNRKLFFEYFDGYSVGGSSFVRLDRLLATSVRHDHDPNIPLEEYVQRGEERAKERACETLRDHLQAYMEADRFQLARCQEIHAVLARGGRMPEWIRADVFRVLQHEAMKQYHAGKLAEDTEGLVLIANAPTIRMAVQANAKGEVSETLQKLLRETLSDSGYAGSAGEFARKARIRAAECTIIEPLFGAA